RSAGSITTKGSMASGLFDLILAANCCSRMAMISANVMAYSFAMGAKGRATQLSVRPCLRFRRRGPFLILHCESVGFFHVAELGWKLDVSCACRNRHLDWLFLREVSHALHFILNSHQSFQQSFRPGRATGDVNIHRHDQVDSFHHVVAVLVVGAAAARA